MTSLAYKTERVLKLLSELPPAKVDEVVDFAEYLKEKSLNPKKKNKGVDELPIFHMGTVDSQAFDRSSLYGDRLDSLLA